jgi:hypothetical protein
MAAPSSPAGAPQAFSPILSFTPKSSIMTLEALTRQCGSVGIFLKNNLTYSILYGAYQMNGELV